jgi:hypothetical protein
MKGDNFLDQLIYYQLLKNISALYMSVQCRAPDLSSSSVDMQNAI